MEITKEQSVALLEAIGFKSVAKWSDERIADKIARIADSVDDDIKITDKRLAALFKKVLAAKGVVTVKGVVTAKKGKPAPVVDDEEDEESEDDESEDDESEDEEDEDEEDEDEESEDDEDEDDEDEDEEDEAPPPPVKKGKAKAPAKKAKPAPVDEDDDEAPPTTKEKDPAKVARGKALAASRLAGSVKDAFGNNPESQAGAINAAILAIKKGKKGYPLFSLDEIVTISKLATGRVKNHLKYLSAKGLIAASDGGWKRVK